MSRRVRNQRGGPIGATNTMRAAVAFVGLWACLWESSCAPSGFPDSTVLNSVRVLVTSTDKPFAQPGDTVTMHLLAYDGRPAAQRAVDPMTVSWLPVGCSDPANDAYYACFTGVGADGGTGAFPVRPLGDAPAVPVADAGTGDDGGSGAEGGACAVPDPDSGIAMPVVSSATFAMPADIVAAHPPTPGLPLYGLAIAFNVACAGQVTRAPIDPNGNPQQVPIACVSATGAVQGPDGFVFGFNRVYSYDAGADGAPPLTNANPVIESLDVSGPAFVAGGPPESAPCFQGPGPAHSTAPVLAPLCTSNTPSGKCPSVKLGPVVPPSSQETDPQNGRRELVWVDYYTTFGSLKDDARLLYDPMAGSVGGLDVTDTEFRPPVVGPNDPRDGFVFVVVHDNRGGASWVTVPVHLQPVP